MSVQAFTWAFEQPIKPSSVKFVLVALANYASEFGLVFPSVESLCVKTSLDRKTVLAAIAQLQVHRYMVDTGERRGKTGQVKVYRLLCSSKHTDKGTVNEGDQPQSLENKAIGKSTKGNSTENGTVPIVDAKGPVFPIKGSRFSVERVPKTGHRSVMDPSGDPSVNPIGLFAQPGVDLPDDGFSEIRKAYPARSGSQRWADALSHYRSRLREGAKHDAILAGVIRYAACMRAEGKLGSSQVQQAATFLGTNRCYEEPWAPEIKDKKPAAFIRPEPQRARAFPT